MVLNTVMAEHQVTLALSKRKTVMKYSLCFSKATTKIVRDRGISKFRIVSRKSDCIIMTLQPVKKEKPGAMNEFAFQYKAGGTGHMEFPCSLIDKPLIGIEGKGCPAALRIFASGPMQVRKPTSKNLVKTRNAKLEQEFNKSGITSPTKKGPQLRLI